MDTAILMSQISSLPDNLKEEVADFIGFLNQKLKLNKETEKINERRQMQTAKEIRLSDINGVGAELWANIDIDKYIATEREW